MILNAKSNCRMALLRIYHRFTTFEKRLHDRMILGEWSQEYNSVT